MILSKDFCVNTDPSVADSPIDTTTKQWARDQGISLFEDLAGLGVWGDAAVYNTRDSLNVLLINIITGVACMERLLRSPGHPM